MNLDKILKMSIFELNIANQNGFIFRFGCVEKVTSGEADVTNVDPNGLYLAGKYFNLRPVVTELVDGGKRHIIIRHIRHINFRHLLIYYHGKIII